MRQRKVPTSNHVFALPGGNEDNDLFVEARLDADGNPALTSVWELDDDERELIGKGGTIELHVWGRAHPPVAITVGPSMGQRRGELEDLSANREERAIGLLLAALSSFEMPDDRRVDFLLHTAWLRSAHEIVYGDGWERIYERRVAAARERHARKENA